MNTFDSTDVARMVCCEAAAMHRQPHGAHAGTPVAEVPFAGHHEGPTSRLYLHPDTMHSCRITAAELLLVRSVC